MPIFHRPSLACLSIALLAAASQPALSAPAAGQLLASQCAQCRRTNGAGAGFDSIAVTVDL